MENQARPDHQVLQLNNYDVFISYIGADVRDSFLSRLYARLNDGRKLAVYAETAGLPRGMDIWGTLLQEFETSEVYVAILSPNYVDSMWCLDELVKIVDCKRRYGRRVIPVFYGVDPSGIENHEFPSTATVTADMSSALRKIANLPGFDSQVIRSEAELVEGIAAAVLEALPGGSREENEGWICMATALASEVLSAFFEQRGQALVGMLLAHYGLLLCAVDLLLMARRQRVVWQRKGLIPWFCSTRSPLKHQLFGSLALYFELSAAIWQTFHSTLGYVYVSRWNRENPIKMSMDMLLFGIAMLVATVVKKFPALFNPPSRP